MLQAGNGVGASTFVATLSGSAFLAIVIYLMIYLHSLREEGTINYSNAVGKVGNVYLPVPPKEKVWGRLKSWFKEDLRS